MKVIVSARQTGKPFLTDLARRTAKAEDEIMRTTANSTSKELSVVTTTDGYQIIMNHPHRKADESVSAFVRRILEQHIPELVEAHEPLLPRGKYPRFPEKKAGGRPPKTGKNYPDYDKNDVKALTSLREQIGDSEFTLAELRGLAMAGRRDD